MKRIPLALTLLISTPALASPGTYKLNLELSIGDEQVTKTSLIVREGQQAMISEKRDDSNRETSVSAVVTRVAGTKGAVKVEIQIDESHGRTHTILAKPTVIARFGQQATVEMRSPEAGKSVKLSVVATQRR